MNTINGLINSFATTFKSVTGTGLDALDATPMEALVTEELVNRGTTPATTDDIVSAFNSIAGRAPRTEEVYEVELFLMDFGLAA